MARARSLLPGCPWRPWLNETPPARAKRWGCETRDDRGRVRVTLGGHPYAYRAGWAYRYRLVAAYALGRPLLDSEHVDHRDGVVDHDELSNFRLLTPEMHGAHHAWLFEVAGCRGRDGRFMELDSADVRPIGACRMGPVVSMRGIDATTWLPLSRTLSGCDGARRPEIACAASRRRQVVGHGSRGDRRSGRTF